MQNPSLEQILQNATEKVREISNDKCFAIVIESFRETDDEYTLSLHLISPKLKNYSYRIFEFKCRNEINPFPISAILFAYDTSNNQFLTINDLQSFRSGVDFFVNHALTKNIIDHIISLSSLAVNDQVTTENLTLNHLRKQINFSVENPTKPITLKKIIVTSHFNSQNNDWLNVVLKTQLKISCSGMIGGGTFSNIFPLISFVSAYHNNPVFDINIDVPSKVDMIQFDMNLIKKLDYNLELISDIPQIEMSLLIEKNQSSEI